MLRIPNRKIQEAGKPERCCCCYLYRKLGFYWAYKHTSGVRQDEYHVWKSTSGVRSWCCTATDRPRATRVANDSNPPASAPGFRNLNRLVHTRVVAQSQVRKLRQLARSSVPSQMKQVQLVWRAENWREKNDLFELKASEKKEWADQKNI